MANNTGSAADVEIITSVLTPSVRAGVVFHAVLGGISAISLVVLLGHIVTVSFLPLCLSALNIRKSQETTSLSSSTMASASVEVVSMAGLPDRRKSNSMVPHKTPDDDYGIDVERSRAAAERRARARAREISRQNTKYNEEKMFLRMQLGIFVACMLTSDLIQTVGVLIQARWAYLGYVQTGTACWIQAAALTFGDVATAVWNSVIALHTFSTVVLGKRMSTLGIAVLVIIGWSIPVMMNVIGSEVIARSQPTKPYYNVASAWCFIANDYVTPRVVLHYVPLLTASLIITVMYALVSLTMRGNLQVSTTSGKGCFSWFSVTFRRTNMRKSMSGNTNHKQVAYLRTLSLKMLWYPCVYICLILPISICRMVELRGSKAPADLLFFAMTLLFCVGISNVAIYVTTRNVGLHSKRSQGVHSTRPAGGTQVEIYVDRVTQNDVGVVTIGGTGLHGRDKSIRFEGDDDLKGTIYQKTEYDGSVRGSLEYSYAEAKSPTSSTRFVSTSPRTSTSVPVYQYTLRSPTPARDNRLSAGRVVVDRVGTPRPSTNGAAFESSFREPAPMAASVPSPVRSPSEFRYGAYPVSVAGQPNPSAYHTWEQSTGP